MLSKSSTTNLACCVLIAIGLWLRPDHVYLLNMGFFGLSGALTNWLAIHMLFEKVPGLYGSGIIPLQFEEFKAGIRQLIMTQFFSSDNVERFINDQITSHSGTMTPDLSPIVSSLDFEKLFEKLLEAVETSPLGPLVQMMGGRESLSGLKENFTEKTQEALEDMIATDSFQSAFKKVLTANFSGTELIERIELIVDQRLNELTPNMVKSIIQDMIREHLGWLVVWGGLFGSLIGLATTAITSAS